MPFVRSRWIKSRWTKLCCPKILCPVVLRAFLISGLAFVVALGSISLAQDLNSVPSGNIFDPDPDPENDGQRAIGLFNQGKYDDAIALAGAIDASLGKFSNEEKWRLLIVSAQMQKGDFPAAKAVNSFFR